MLARNLLKKHFPDFEGEALQIEIELMMHSLICEGSHLDMIVKNSNIKAVDDMRRGFMQFWKAYKELDHTLKSFVKAPKHTEICEMYWELTGRDPLEDFPRVLFMKPNYPVHKGAFDKLEAAIEKEATHIHHHAKNNQYPQKAALVRFARDQWRRIKKTSPAVKPSEGTAFYTYLEDLTEYVGQDWSISSLLRAEQAASSI